MATQLDDVAAAKLVQFGTDVAESRNGNGESAFWVPPTQQPHCAVCSWTVAARTLLDVADGSMTMQCMVRGLLYRALLLIAWDTMRTVANVLLRAEADVNTVDTRGKYSNNVIHFRAHTKVLRRSFALHAAAPHQRDSLVKYAHTSSTDHFHDSVVREVARGRKAAAGPARPRHP